MHVLSYPLHRCFIEKHSGVSTFEATRGRNLPIPITLAMLLQQLVHIAPPYKP